MSIEIATLAGGCFWCTEAVFNRVKGVTSVMSGYSGGDLDNPSYEDIGTGKTGHAEAIQIEFDPSVISFSELLDVFWATHDPTTLNRQGADEGTQYRSAIFYHNEAQKKTAEESKKKVESTRQFNDPIVTEIAAFKNFYPAEEEHREFYERNRQYGYCRVVIDPKVKKLLDTFPQKLK